MDAHIHPVPVIDTNVSPAGAVSTTVTMPVVGPAEALLETVTVYVAPVCPWRKFPVWVLLMLRTGGLVPAGANAVAPSKPGV